MSSKAMTGVVVCGLLLASQAAWADHDRGWRGRHGGGHVTDYDYARVVDVDPIVRRVRVSVPHRECWMETRYEHVDHGPHGGHHHAAGSMIVGGLIGAAIGNQFGRGDGRRAATVAGALIGTALGHDAAARHHARHAGPVRTEAIPYEVERCDVRYEDRYEERIEGYHVTYVYNGRQHTTRLPYDPGDRIRVRVDVRPDDC